MNYIFLRPKCFYLLKMIGILMPDYLYYGIKNYRLWYQRVQAND